MDTTYWARFEHKHLYQIQFTPCSDMDTFGFVNPDEIIRAAHIIPAFCHEATEDLLPGNSVAHDNNEVDDWRYLYVNIYVPQYHII